jgi:hypothetical protein
VSARAIAAAELTVARVSGSYCHGGLPTVRHLGVRHTLGGTTPTLTITAVVPPRHAFDTEWVAHANAYAV